MTLTSAIEDYLADKAIALSVASIRNYASYLRKFAQFIGDIELRKITNQKIRQYQEAIKAKGLKDSTLFEYSMPIKMLLEHFGLDAVAKKIGLPKYAHDSWPEAKDEHVTAMLKELKRETLVFALRDELLILFKQASGLRTSELTGIRLGMLDFRNKSAVIIGKGKKKRVFFWSDLVHELLVKYLDERESIAKCDNLFINKYGKRISNNYVCWLYRDLRQRANIHERIVPHSSRVAFITKGVRGNLNLAILKELAGHEFIGTTEGYVRLTNPDLKEAYNKVYNVAD